MKAHRLIALAAVLGCVALGAIAPSAGCNGTGTTPICDFPDGANNPESGCGQLVEAAVPDVAPPEDSPVDSPSGHPDASDATVPVDAADSGHVDAPADVHEDVHDAGVADSKSDAKG